MKVKLTFDIDNLEKLEKLNKLIKQEFSNYNINIDIDSTELEEDSKNTG